MGFFSRDIKTLNDLFIHALRAIYYAEKKIAKSLPDMVDKASDNGLKDGFERHCDQTEVHIERLEKAFEMLGAEARTAGCPAIDGILDEVAQQPPTAQVADEYGAEHRLWRISDPVRIAPRSMRWPPG